MWLVFWEQNFGSQQEDYVLFVEQQFLNPLSYSIQKENKSNDKHNLSSRKALNEYMTVTFSFYKSLTNFSYCISSHSGYVFNLFFYFAKEFYLDM